LKGFDAVGKKQKQAIVRSNDWFAKVAMMLLLLLLCLLLFVGPFYRGLFFTQDLLIAQAIVFGMLIIWGAYRLFAGGGNLRKSPLDICFLALLLAYFISFFVAVHTRDALEQLLKIAMYLVVYLVAFELSVSKIWPLNCRKTELVNDDQSSMPIGLNLILHLALAAAVVVTIASIGAAAGHWYILGAYQDAGLRIASPLGYSNTAAAYLMAAYFLNIGLATLADSWWKRCMYLMPAVLILTTTILTFSRGAWLLLPPLFILMVLASAPGMRLRSFLLMIATMIPAIPAAFWADPLFRSSNPPDGWVPLVLAMAVSFLLGALFEYYLNQKYRTKLVLGVTVLAALLISIFFIIVFPLFNISAQDVSEPAGQESLSVEQRLEISLSNLLPERYHDRIFSVGRDRNLGARLEMFRDAIKIIKDYPLFGAGGGGFRSLYQGYQERIYYSTEVHNHFLQVWVEAGILGFLAFVGIWFSLTLVFIRNCIKNKATTVRWQNWATVFVPVAALGAHSAIDWNFSLAAVGIYLFVLLGASKSLDQIDWFKKEDISLKSKDGRQRKWTGIMAIVTGTLLLICTLVLIKGFYSTWQSQLYLEQGNLKQAVVELGEAIRYDPLRAENYFNLSVLFDEQARSSGDRTELQQLVYLAQRAHELEPYNPTYAYRYGELLLNYVDPQKGLTIIDRITDLRPLEVNSYLQAGVIRLQLAEFYLGSGNIPEAERYLAGIKDLEQKMIMKTGDASPLAFMIGRALFLMEDYEGALYYLKMVPESDPYYQSALEHLDAIENEQEDTVY
jgi:tetratricopeptide (TPR) repeat protein